MPVARNPRFFPVYCLRRTQNSKRKSVFRLDKAVYYQLLIRFLSVSLCQVSFLEK